MIIKQGTKGMDEKDKKEIIKKINMDNSIEENVPEENEQDENPEMSNDMQMESKSLKFTKKQIFENFGIVMNNQDEKSNEPDTKIKSDTLRNRRTRPFEAPKKFKE